MDERGANDADRESGESAPARFQRFERVVVTDAKGRPHSGTIVWRDLVEYSGYAAHGFEGPPARWTRWEYAVDLPDFASCPTLGEDRLQATGEFDPEDAHLGRRFEISFDTGLDEDDSVVEGSYRVPGEFWQIYLFQKEGVHGMPVTELRPRKSTWPSGITGYVFDVPSEAVLNKRYIFSSFSSLFGNDDWVEVRGPDSLLMK